MRLFMPVLLTLCVLVAGCPTSGGGGNGTKSLPIDKLAQEAAETYCTTRLQCDPMQADKMDSDACIDFFMVMYENDLVADLIAYVDEGKITYDGEKAAECIAAMKTNSCSDEEPAACDEVWQGNAAPGGECTRDEECAAGYCDESLGCPGVCTAYKQAGEACGFDDICTSGYDCIDDLCKAEPEIVDGAPCEAYDNCAGMAVCVADKEGVETGTCQSRLSLFRLGEGADCDFTQYQDIYSGFVKHDVALCKPELSCVIESVDLANGTSVSTCKKALASGAECGYGAPDPCPSDEYCTADPTADKLSGACTKLPIEGEPCLDLQTVQAKCGPNLQCEDNNICTPPKVLGDSCTQDKDCVSGHCDDQSGTCALRPECS
jgi:hypothetical protein